MDVIPGATRKNGQKQLPSDSRFERQTETKKKPPTNDCGRNFPKSYSYINGKYIKRTITMKEK